MQLKNQTKRTITLNLDHDVVCSEEHCLCSFDIHSRLELDPKTGDTGVRETERRLCASVFILPGQTSRDVPDSVLNLPKVQALISGRSPQIKKVAVEAAA